MKGADGVRGGRRGSRACWRSWVRGRWGTVQGGCEGGSRDAEPQGLGETRLLEELGEVVQSGAMPYCYVCP